jgi:hypothetical protein
MLWEPDDASPDAMANTYAIGPASYRSLSLPDGDLRSAGYMKSPPWRRVLWTSATMVPTYLRVMGDRDQGPKRWNPRATEVIHDRLGT